MRFVPAPPAPPLDLPPRETIDRARDLPGRFPDAGLRPVDLVRARDLDASADHTGKTHVWLANETRQTTGSFKVRGALLAISNLAARGVRRVIAVSAGNHGAGTAHAARVIGVTATVVVPRSAPQTKRDKIAAAGAELIVHASDLYDDAEAAAKELSTKTGDPFLSPYDDLDVALGNGGSLGFEIARALGKVPDKLIVPVGGGGLATGLAWAFASENKSAALPQLLFGAQSAVSCACARSLETGVAVERDEPEEDTFADGLAGGISSGSFERVRRALGGVAVVSEKEIAQAMSEGHARGITLEGSAAAALAPILAGLPETMRGGDVVVLLTGSNVDRARLESALAFC